MTPNPATPPPDALFETGCCLCGSNEEFPRSKKHGTHPGVSGLLDEYGGFANVGARYCNDCWLDHGSVRELDAEITRRRALRPAPTAEPVYWGTQPKELPSELPDGTLCHAGWAHYGLKLREGYYFYSRAELGGLVIGRAAISPRSIDWATTPKSPSRPAPPQEQIPATRFVVGDMVRHRVSPEIVGRVTEVSAGYRGGTLYSIAPEGEDKAVYAYFENDIEAVPAAAGSVGETYVVAAWGIPGADRAPRAARGPQCRECGQETTKLDHDGLPKCTDCQCMAADAILGKGEANEPLDQRIAASRQSEQSRPERAASSHPRSWPEGACDDVGELYSTHGSGR